MRGITHIQALAVLIALLAGAFSVHAFADDHTAARVVADGARETEAAMPGSVASEATPEDSIQDGDIPLSAGLDANGDGEIDVYTDNEHPQDGDIVTLSTPMSKVPYDGGLLTQWLVDRGDGRGFTAIAGANDKTYSYTHSDACAHYRFRVALYAPPAKGD